VARNLVGWLAALGWADWFSSCKAYVRPGLGSPCAMCHASGLRGPVRVSLSRPHVLSHGCPVEVAETEYSTRRHACAIDLAIDGLGSRLRCCLLPTVQPKNAINVLAGSDRGLSGATSGIPAVAETRGQAATVRVCAKIEAGGKQVDGRTDPFVSDVSLRLRPLYSSVAKPMFLAFRPAEKGSRPSSPSFRPGPSWPSRLACVVGTCSTAVR